MNISIKRLLGIFLSVVITMPCCMLLPGGSVLAAGAKIYDLKVCETSDPIGIDTTPIFSWKVDDIRRGAALSAYRIIVSSTEALAKSGTGDLWDSGKTDSEHNYNIAYEGQALQSKTTYFWSVEVWNEKGVSVGRSDISSFHTGILEYSEWGGDWIGIPKQTTDIDFSDAKWIWLLNGRDPAGADGGYQYTRKIFTIDSAKTVSEVLIAHTADNQSELYFNGVKQTTTASWGTGTWFNATDYVAAGNNTVAIAGYNEGAGNAGIIAKIRVKYADGTTDIYVSDNSWKISDSQSDGWYEKNFDDSSWSAPDQLISFGESPWGEGISLEQLDALAALTMRKEFLVSKTVTSAYAYICGLGCFDLTLNGVRPYDSYMNPCNTQYDQSALYCTFDVSEYVKPGANAIGVELGNSFYNEIGGVWNWPNSPWRDNPKLLFNLEITYSDGTKEMIVSDNSWKLTNDGPIVTNSVYYGESYDAGKELGEFDTVGYNDSGWDNASVMSAPTQELNCQIMDPVRKTQQFSPMEIRKLENGAYVVYAPEMVAGWIKLKNIDEAAGSIITVIYGEKLHPDGSVQKISTFSGGDAYIGGNEDRFEPYAYWQHDTYIAKGSGDESFEPKFTYKGFEYVQINGYSGELTVDDVEIYRTANDVEIVSEIETSNKMVNDLHKIMRTTLLNNFQGKPTDTPTYEKNGWLGDANVALKTMMYNFDMSNYMPNFVEIMEDCFDAYGTVPCMVPTSNSFVENAAVWNTIYVYAVAELCNYYGLYNYCEAQYDSMRKFALKDIDEIKNNGWVWFDGQFSDWCAPYGGSDPSAGMEAGQSEGSGIAGTGYVYGMLEEMAEMAQKLGKTADETEYRAAMASIKTAFNRKFYNPSKQIYETTVWNQVGNRTKYRQTSNLVPLAFGLIEEENVDAVLENLIKDIEEKDFHLDTGIVGTKEILPVLCDYGYSDVAFKILTQTTYPSWGYWLTQGATSAWEQWEILSRSYDHYFFGTYDQWIYSHLAGITDIKDGYKTFTIKPYLIGDIDYLDASVKTVRGDLKVHWQHNTDGTAEVKVTVPYGSTAQIVLPTASLRGATVDDGKLVSDAVEGITDAAMVSGQLTVTVGSGEYTFITKTDLNDVYKDTLSAAISAAEQIDTRTCPAELAAALGSAVENAKQVFSDDVSNQKAVNDASSAIEALLAEINGSDVKNSLKKLLDEVKSENPAADQYGYAAFMGYQSAVLTAEKLLDRYDVSDEQYAEARAQLLAAVNSLRSAKYQNLAKGKTAAASSSDENGYWGWGLSKLTDGDTKNINTGNEYAGYSSAEGTEEWVSIDLGAATDINNLTIYSSCSQSGGKMDGTGFPKDFEIQISKDGETWTTVYERTDYPMPEYGPQSFDFDTVSAQYVKFVASRLGDKKRLQLSEAEVYYKTAGEKTDVLLCAELDLAVISPVFNTNTFEYNAVVSDDVTSLKVTPYATEGAAILVNGQSCKNGQASAGITLKNGMNTITVSVGGQDTVIKVQRGDAYIKGDFNSDGVINVLDVVGLRQTIMGGNITDEDLSRGDLDGDGNITVSDVVQLRLMIMNQAK